MTNREIHEIIGCAYRYAIKNNEGKDNPYHNNKHLEFVFHTSMSLFNKYKKEYDLKSNDMIDLGVACFFHDFNHSGGRLKDSDNINLALEGFHKFTKENWEIELNKDNVINLIRFTEYPHKHKENLSILEMIILDADITIPDDIISTAIALCSEINISHPVTSHKKDLLEFIEDEFDYIDNIKYHLPYSNARIDQNREKFKKDLLKFKSDLVSK
jgi:hypothetical protein